MIHINEQDKQVAEYLGLAKIPYSAHYLGYSDSDGWKADKWAITFGGESFEYRTGIGHRVIGHGRAVKYSLSRKDSQTMRELRRLLNVPSNERVIFEAGDTLKDGTRKPKTLYDVKPTYAVKPTQASVLYCLLSDADCGAYTFNEFCSELGYDSDSRKAEKIYFACQDTGEKLQRVFSRVQLEKLRELLEDY